MKDKFAEIAVKETYRAKSIKGNVYNWNTVIGDGRRIVLYFLCKNEELCILHFDIRLPVSVKNHSFQHHNDGKKVYLDKIPLYDYNYVHNHIDTKLQIQVTKIRRYGYGHKKYLCCRSRSTLI